MDLTLISKNNWKQVRQKKIFISIVAIIGLALAAMALWLTELIWKIGWDHFSWLQGAQDAIFGINALTVLAYLAPVAIIKGISWKKLWMPALELYFIAIIAFFITKSILYSLFLPFAIFDLSPYILWLMLGTLVLTTAGSFFYLTRNYLYPVKVAFIPVMIGVELFAALSSVLAAYLMTGQNVIDQLLLAAVKAGFPFFFFTLFLGLFSILSISKLSLQPKGKEREEILDDIML